MLLLTRRLCLLTCFVLPTAALGQRDDLLRPQAWAIVDAKIVTAGKTIPKGTILIRRGLIETVSVGKVALPPDAAIIDGSQLTVYPGFLDGGAGRGYDPALRRSEIGPPSPEDLASEPLIATKPDHRKGLTPEFSVRTALKLDDETQAPWRKVGFTAQLVVPEGGYVSGRSALVSLSGQVPRFAIVKADLAQHVALRTIPGGDYPRALMGVVAHARQFFLDAGHHDRLLQEFAKRSETGPRPAADAGLEALKPCLDGSQPVIFDADDGDAIHRALDFAAEFGLKPILFGGRDALKAVDRLALTNTPVILRLRDDEPAAREQELPFRVQIERAQRRQTELKTAGLLAKLGIKIAFATGSLSNDKGPETVRTMLRKLIDAGLSEDAALAALTHDAAELLGVSPQLGSIAPGKAAHLILATGNIFAKDTKILSVFADGIRFEIPPKTKKDEPTKDDNKPKAEPEDKKPPVERIEAKRTAAQLLFAALPIIEERTVELESDRKALPRTRNTVAVVGATILTGTGETIRNGALHVESGTITYVGPADKAPEFVGKVVRADGMFLMPGIVDTHSHFAIHGSVNEFSLSVVPEVRVRDVIASDDVQIYRAAAGGVTTARLLHGSANVIGGQDAVIKMKYGADTTNLLVANAPRGVKFALGENVKRTDGRFPNTRLGVEAVLVRAFTEAAEYRRTWEEWRKTKVGPEPRRDLRLEALADILRGDLKIHCHCYRADEILMLLRVAERFGIKIQSLQHVLEGYKVAPEIAQHGASVSLFADWWAYKIEAYDAIPYAGALMHKAGISVCLKSDSNELMRHLYQEAAKLVKYGGMSEKDAIAAITLNPAKQLGLDKKLGSLEVGKDGDFVVFNGHPLSGYSRVEATFIEGETYFLRRKGLDGDFPTWTASDAAPVGAPILPAFTGSVSLQQGEAYLLKDVVIHTGTGTKPSVGSLLINSGRIVGIGKNLPAEPKSVVTIDGRGELHVFPGLIDSGTVLGLIELDSAKETIDYLEGGDFQPDLRAAIGINPDSELIPVTRANGITTVVTRPTGGIVAGQAVLIHLAGWTPEQMILVDPLGLHIEFPRSLPFVEGDPIAAAPFMGQALQKKQREEKLKRLKDLFAQARRYDAARKADPKTPINPRLAALAPYLDRTKPVMIAANRKQEILDALKFAKEENLKVIITGGLEAWRVTEALKAQDAAVILGPIMALPTEGHDRYDAPFTCAAKLAAAGVRFCFRSHGASNARNLPYEAAMAVSYGLSPERALQAVTSDAANLLGIGDRYGSIALGKQANIVLASGDPLQPTTSILAVLIDGKPQSIQNKQTRLFERYQERLKESTGSPPSNTAVP